MNKAGERLYNGLVKENPTFVLMLGMCPTLAVTTSAMNGLGMGLTTMVVLALSNLIISLLRNIIPNRVRIPAFIVIIASFVTAVQLLLEAYIPSLNKSLGVYIPLIVVNCIILGRAESYAYSNPPIPSLFDGIGMGLGFTFALTCIGAVRELIGAGELFGFGLMPDSFEPVRIFGQAPGAFFVLAALVALQNYIKSDRKKKGKSYEKIGSGCTEDCVNCGDMNCKRRFYDANSADEEHRTSASLPKDKKSSNGTPTHERGQEVKKNGMETPARERGQEVKKNGMETPAQERRQEVKNGTATPVRERETEVKNGTATPARERGEEVEKTVTATPAQEHRHEVKESGIVNRIQESVQDEISEELAFEELQEVKDDSNENYAHRSLPEDDEDGEESLMYESLHDEDGEESLEYESLHDEDDEESYISEKPRTAQKEGR